MSDYAIPAAGVPAAGVKERTAARMDRKTWDTLISGAGAIVAAVLMIVGVLAVVGGTFAHSNVRDRLVPQSISFPPATAMTAEEKADIGQFAGAKVDTGTEAEAFSRYIGGHLTAINDGATYSETSSAARAEGLDPKVAAELQGKADSLFKGETLRSILLNAYGWWTVGTITLFAGYAIAVAGVVLALLAALGFRHARRNV